MNGFFDSIEFKTEDGLVWYRCLQFDASDYPTPGPDGDDIYVDSVRVTGWSEWKIFPVQNGN